MTVLTFSFWYAVTAMNSVSLKTYVRNVEYGSFRMSLARTRWNRGWYLCIEFRIVCGRRIKNRCKRTGISGIVRRPWLSHWVANRNWKICVLKTQSFSRPSSLTALRGAVLPPSTGNWNQSINMDYMFEQPARRCQSSVLPRKNRSQMAMSIIIIGSTYRTYHPNRTNHPNQPRPQSQPPLYDLQFDKLQAN